MFVKQIIIDTPSQPVKQAAESIVKYLQAEKPYLFVIDDHIKGKNGVIDIKLRVYEGQVQDIVITDIKRYAFKVTKP